MFICRLPETQSNQLTFSCNFEGGNVDFVRPADNGLDYDVHVRQDSNAPKHRLWFHMQMQGGYAGADSSHLGL